jgi:uncharacterized Zn-finger protein
MIKHTMEKASKNHAILMEETFICDICGKEFDSISSLQGHKRRHNSPVQNTEDSQREIRGDIGAAGLPTSPTL